MGSVILILLVNDTIIRVPAKVIRFNQLMHLLPQGTDQQATIRALQIVAVMVQGCWVVKRYCTDPQNMKLLPLSLLLFLCDKVYHKLEECYLLYFLGQT